ncbi:carbohydrate ABC transporter permease [Phytoactinopolyspora endophytica]|uniref:carbohydrate ABC transporter permease n=1 Tax=Phytoactinopolyspora endophytica TaxID=1642495 RepID=UPI00197C5918|nr:sugar ABC transporter permease [Phytoactinopolyspora endophytica]
MSFNEWAGAGPMTFAGFANYARMASDPVFVTSFVNTMWTLFGVGAAVFVVSFALTMLLQNMLGRKFIRLVIFFPSLVPGVVVGILWGFLFNADGLVNTVIGGLGVDDPPGWLSQEHMFKIILLGIMWLHTGVYTVILMAAADRIPRDLYEAADLAGATPWQRFRYVTLPLMWDVVSVCIVLWCVQALKIFEFILVFTGTGGLPDRGVWNLALFSYAEAFPTDGTPAFGMAAATGMLILVLAMVFTVLARWVLRRDDVQY